MVRCHMERPIIRARKEPATEGGTVNPFELDLNTLEMINDVPGVIMEHMTPSVANIPVFIIAWRGIGKRFAFFTFINVLLASAFTSVLRYADENFFHVP